MKPKRESEIRRAVDSDLFAELPVAVVVDLLAELEVERLKVRRLEGKLRSKTGEVDLALQYAGHLERKLHDLGYSY